MPIRRLALALCATLLLVGCTTQRDSADTQDTSGGDGSAEADTAEGATAEADTVTTRGGPNVPVYIYGTWDFTATQIGGDDTITGVLTIAEEPGASRLAASNGVDAALAIEEMDVTNTSFVLSGTLEGAEPMSLSLAGSLAGDEMTAEADMGARGVYALTATRRQP